MKRKMTALLTVVLMLAMLAGCGDSSQTATSGGSASDSASGISKETVSSKGGTLSECLSTEKVIAYEVDTVDKSETPDNIYFFENGKVTIIPGEEFGLTMGDFAQMADKEIWSTYETVREAYIEKYVSEKLESAKSDIEGKIQSAENDLEIFTSDKDLLESGLNGEVDDISSLVDLVLCWGELTVEEEQQIGEAGRLDVLSEEKITAIRNSLDTCINKDTSEIAELQAKLEELTCATPFCDMSFSFVVKTDASGNNAQSESLVYPTLKYDVGEEAPDTLYDSLDFALGLTTGQQIYDTTYNCIALSGSGRFCTRETMETDTIDSKNVLVDLSKDEINELFREEVMARYE